MYVHRLNEIMSRQFSTFQQIFLPSDFPDVLLPARMKNLPENKSTELRLETSDIFFSFSLSFPSRHVPPFFNPSFPVPLPFEFKSSIFQYVSKVRVRYSTTLSFQTVHRNEYIQRERNRGRGFDLIHQRKLLDFSTSE